MAVWKILIMPQLNVPSVTELKEMVKEINASEVEPEDRLMVLRLPGGGMAGSFKSAVRDYYLPTDVHEASFIN